MLTRLEDAVAAVVATVVAEVVLAKVARVLAAGAAGHLVPMAMAQMTLALAAEPSEASPSNSDNHSYGSDLYSFWRTR